MNVGDYCKQAITITGRGTLQANGKYNYGGTVTTTVARVIEESGTLLQPGGIIWQYSHIMYLKPGEAIALQDRITYSSTAYTVIKLYKGRDINGTLQHIKAWVN